MRRSQLWRSLQPTHDFHFTQLKKFALSVSDDRDHHARRRRIARYLTWRNRQAGAEGSPLAQFTRIKLHGH